MNNKIELRPIKKIPPTILPYLLAVSYMIILGLGIFICVNLIKANYSILIIPLIIILCISLILIFCSKYFSWFITETITKKGDHLYIEITDTVSNSSSFSGITKIKIFKLTKIKKRGIDLFLYGDIEKIEVKHKSNPTRIRLLEAGLNEDCIKFLEKEVIA